MIYIGTSLDKKYFKKRIKYIKDCLLSLEKNSKFFNFVVCVGFNPPKNFKSKFENIHFLHIEEKNLKTVRKDWPANRKKFICLESGEFLDLMDIRDDDVVIFIDIDMVMQRPLSKEEQKMLENMEENEIGLYYDDIPPTNLLVYYIYLEKWANWGIEKAQKIFDGNWRDMVKCNTGCVVGKVSAWKVVRKYYIENFMNITNLFSHHSAGQWLLTWIVFKYLKFKILPHDFHNAHWFNGSLAKYKENRLRVEDKIVLFAHTRFDISPDY